MNLLDIYYQSLGKLVRMQADEILELNRRSSDHNLQLSHQEALELIASKNQSLAALGRIEPGSEAILSIINAFFDSPYMHPKNYADTLGELLEIFYYMKNETEDHLSDQKLLQIMKELFNTTSRGSLELLKDRDLAVFVRIFRCYLKTAQPY